MCFPYTKASDSLTHLMCFIQVLFRLSDMGFVGWSEAFLPALPQGADLGFGWLSSAFKGYGIVISLSHFLNSPLLLSISE